MIRIFLHLTRHYIGLLALPMPRFLITIPSRLLYHIPKWHVQYSQKAFSALSNVPFRIMKQHVPCIGKGIYCSPLCKNVDIQRITFVPYNACIRTQSAVFQFTRHSQ